MATFCFFVYLVGILFGTFVLGIRNKEDEQDFFPLLLLWPAVVCAIISFLPFFAAYKFGQWIRRNP